MDKRSRPHCVPITFLSCDDTRPLKKEQFKRTSRASTYIVFVVFILLVGAVAYKIHCKANTTYAHQDLLDSCGGNSCCYSSVRYMSEKGYAWAGKNNVCPNGFKKGMLKCIGSIVWCEKN